MFSLADVMRFILVVMFLISAFFTVIVFFGTFSQHCNESSVVFLGSASLMLLSIIGYFLSKIAAHYENEEEDD